jgi:carboxyl-terminal processing protease
VIDRSTSGPAEVIAAAVRDQKRGELVGERTFGSGSDQQLFRLSDEGALLITTAKYAPAAGKAFMEEPVNPTLKVDRPVEAEPILPDGDDDEDSEEKPDQQPQVTPPKPVQPVDDVQLKKAFEIIKQTPVKAQAAQKRAAMKAPLPSGVALHDVRITT